ncbi:hypothetical protein DSECCO2_350990 [anaerobic digester metagenome]
MQALHLALHGAGVAHGRVAEHDGVHGAVIRGDAEPAAKLRHHALQGPTGVPAPDRAQTQTRGHELEIGQGDEGIGLARGGLPGRGGDEHVRGFAEDDVAALVPGGQELGEKLHAVGQAVLVHGPADALHGQHADAGHDLRVVHQREADLALVLARGGVSHGVHEAVQDGPLHGLGPVAPHGPAAFDQVLQSVRRGRQDLGALVRVHAENGQCRRGADGQAVLASDAQALALFADARQPLAHVYDAHGAVGRALAALDAAGLVYGKIEHGTSWNPGRPWRGRPLFLRPEEAMHKGRQLLTTCNPVA